MSKNVVVKICGLMREEDVKLCVDCGTDIIGFVVEYPVDVPWNMKRERAAELIKYFREYTQQNSSKAKCCIVSGGGFEKLAELAKLLKPDYIQMHYKEDANDVRELSKALEGTSVKIVKTVPSDVQDIGECAALYESSGADMLLVDARNSENAASSHAMLDGELFNTVRDAVKIPVMAAGGITPENVADIIDGLGPEIIDLMTGVEEKHGVKSEEKVKKLFEKINEKRTEG
jgi:phosphoribosylanthranilate isomerase